MHFLNRILQVQSNICVDLSHRALRHCCLLSIAIYGGSLSLHRTDSHLPVPALGSILFQSKCLSLQQRLLSICFARPDGHRRSARLLCSIRLDSCEYGRELSLISQSHLLFIDRISRVCCLHLLRCTTPWLPVSPGHRIASHHITTGPELSTEPDRVLPGRQEPEGPKTRLALLTPALRIFLNFLVIFALPAVVVRHWRSTRFFCPPPPPVVAPFFLHHSLFFLFSSSLLLLSHPHPPIELSRVSSYSLLVLFFYCSLR